MCIVKRPVMRDENEDNSLVTPQYLAWFMGNHGRPYCTVSVSRKRHDKIVIGRGDL